MEPGKCTTLYRNINVQSIYIHNISLKNYNSFPVHKDDIPADDMTNDKIKTNQVEAMETTETSADTNHSSGHYFIAIISITN